MKKSIFLIGLFSGLLFAGLGQLPQVVILKNGSEIRGKVIENPTNIIVETKSGNIWVFENSEVDTSYAVHHRRATSGPFIHIEPVVLVGSQINGTAHLKLGYDFNRKWSAGLGSSLEFYNNYAYFPLFAELKYHIFNHHITPYVNVQSGYLFPSNGIEHRKGGFMVSGSLNMVCYTGEHFGITIGGGYRFNRLVTQQMTWFGEEDTYIHLVNRIEIKMGILFK